MPAAIANAALGATLACIAACALPHAPTLEYLDEASAASITAVATPLVFARPRPDLASHARDYARLVAVDVNRAGRHEQWLLVYFHSTVDPRVLASPPDVTRSVVLLADDREIRLVRDTRSTAQVGIVRPVHAPAGTASAPAMYRVDRATLAFVAGALRLTLRVEAQETPFELWSDGRPSLAELVHRSNGGS